ncbi:hypothetical protein Vretifemale_10550, partial [Volvox reticuliferus]
STTQCITGAEIGVGLTDNIRSGINFKLFGKQVLAWIFTLIVAGFFSAALFSFGVFAPSLTMAKDIAKYENNIRYVTEMYYKKLNTSNYKLNSTFKAFDAKLNKMIVDTLSEYKKTMFNLTKIGYVQPDRLLYLLNATFAAYANYSVVTVGFNPSTMSYVPTNSTVLADTTIQVLPYNATNLKGV